MLVLATLSCWNMPLVTLKFKHLNTKKDFLEYISRETALSSTTLSELLNTTLDEAIAGAEKLCSAASVKPSKEQFFLKLMYYWIKTTEYMLVSPTLLHKHITIPVGKNEKEKIISELKDIQRRLYQPEPSAA